MGYVSKWARIRNEYDFDHVPSAQTFDLALEFLTNYAMVTLPTDVQAMTEDQKNILKWTCGLIEAAFSAGWINGQEEIQNKITKLLFK